MDGGERVAAYKSTLNDVVNDPFGFLGKKLQAQRERKKQWAAFDAFIKDQQNTNAGGAVKANQQAFQAVHDKEQGLAKWKGVAWPPLVYPENHWRKQGKWESTNPQHPYDYNDGEEKRDPPWRHAGKPAYWYRILPPVKYPVKFDPFGFGIKPK